MPVVGLSRRVALLALSRSGASWSMYMLGDKPLKITNPLSARSAERDSLSGPFRHELPLRLVASPDPLSHAVTFFVQSRIASHFAAPCLEAHAYIQRVQWPAAASRKSKCPFEKIGAEA